MADADNTIPYTVTWDGADVNYSSASKGLIGTSDIDCFGEGDASLAVNFNPEDFNGAPTGTYFDVLTIPIAPE